jgi:NADPH:quinone reductase-like Zn-dependent oxidoreductase
MALVMAVAAGARVAATSRSEQKRAQARVLGAELAVDYHGNDWIAQVRRWADEHGPDLVIDGAGGSSLEAALEVVRPGGRIALYGATLGNVPNLTARRIFWKQLTLVGTTMGSPADFQAMLDFTTAHQIHPPIDSVFPLSDIGKAMRRLDQGGQFGKIVLEIS